MPGGPWSQDQQDAHHLHPRGAALGGCADDDVVRPEREPAPPRGPQEVPQGERDAAAAVGQLDADPPAVGRGDPQVQVAVPHQRVHDLPGLTVGDPQYAFEIRGSPAPEGHGPQDEGPVRGKAVVRRRREVGVEFRPKPARFTEEEEELLIAGGNRNHSRRLLTGSFSVNAGPLGQDAAGYGISTAKEYIAVSRTVLRSHRL